MSRSKMLWVLIVAAVLALVWALVESLGASHDQGREERAAAVSTAPDETPAAPPTDDDDSAPQARARTPAPTGTPIPSAAPDATASPHPLEPTRFADGLVVFRIGGGPSEFTDDTRSDIFGVRSGRLAPAPPVRIISGRIVDEGGAPVVGAAVVASALPGVLPGPKSGEGELGGRAGDLSDDSGRFDLRVSSSRQTVIAFSDEHGWAEPVGISRGDDDVTGLELIVQGTATLAGEVTIAGAAATGHVSALRRDDATQVLGRARIDDEGRYTMTLAPGSYVVRAQETVGEGWTEGETGRRQTVELELTAGERAEHDFVFGEGHRVEVRSDHGGQRVGYYLLEAPVEAFPALNEAIADPAQTVLSARPTPDDEEQFAVFEGVEATEFTVCATVSSLGSTDGLADCKRVKIDDSSDTQSVTFAAM